MRWCSAGLASVVCFGGLLCSCGKAPETLSKAQTKRILYYQDPMHPSYRSDHPGIAPDCNMPLVPVYAGDDVSAASTVRLTPHQEAAIGYRTEIVRDENAGGQIRTPGRVQPEESRTYKVTAGADGWVRRIHEHSETGSTVFKGQPLASYYSRDIAAPQQSYLYAVDGVERLHKMASATADQMMLAMKQMEQARDYLEFLGMTDRQIEDLEKSREEGREVTLGAPAEGVILARNASEGTRFAKGDVLWEIADIDTVWVAADLFPEDLAAVQGIRSATIVLAGGGTYDAAVDSTLPRFASDDRVARLRLVVKNPSHKLLPGMVVDVVLRKPAARSLTVSVDSVLEIGIQPRVFVVRGDGALESRAVSTGWQNAGRVQILNGLKPGERVVAGGAFLIDSESRLNRDAVEGHEDHLDSRISPRIP